MSGWKTGGWERFWWKGAGGVGTLTSGSASIVGVTLSPVIATGLLVSGPAAIESLFLVADHNAFGVLISGEATIVGRLDYYDVLASVQDLYSDVVAVSAVEAGW